MSDSVQSPSVLVVTDNTELVGSLIESNTTEQTFNSRESMQLALDEPELFTNNGIVILDIDSVQGGVSSAIDQALKLKKTDPTQVLMLVGESESLAEILRSNIQPLIYRAFNKPISPNQIFLAFKSANTLHADLTARQASGEDLSVVGPAENRTNVGTISDQRSNKPIIYGAVGLLALAVVGWFVFGSGSDEPTNKVIKTAPAPVISDEVAGPADDTVSEINRLNQLATTASLEGRYTTPKGDNALEYYEQVLNLDPYDTTAYEGKKSVTEALRWSFQGLVERAEFDGALAVINSLQTIEPLNEDNQKLRGELEKAINAHVKKVKASGSVEEIDRTAAVLKKIESEFEGSKAAADALKREKSLLTKIDAALNANNLIPPQKGNAYSLVSDSLKRNTISKANITSRIESLSSKLLGLANSTLEGGNVEETEKLGALIKRLGADSKELSNLNKAIAKQKAAAEAAEKVAAEETAEEAAEEVAVEEEPAKIIPAKIISRAVPRYPKRALNSNTEGWVRVSFDINTDGEPADIQILDAEPEGVFDNAAVKAVRKWRFSPARNQKTGLPIESRIDSTLVQFKLG